MGSVPEWYRLITAARYLRVAPWELLDRPSAWVEMALASSSAENRARKQRGDA